MAYASVIIEGGLFPAELLERIAVGEIGDAPGPAGGGRITAVTETAFSESVRHWRSWQARLPRSRLSPTRLTRDDWMRKLLEILDYDDLEPQPAALSAAGRNFPIYATAGAGPDAPPVHLVGHHQPLDRRDGPGRRSPHALVQEYLNHSDALWGLVSNGEQLRLLRNSARFTRPTYLEFNLRGLMDGNQYAEFVLLYRLLHRSRLPQSGQPPNHCPLEQYYQTGLDLHGRVRERLREGVEAALIALGNGFLQHPESGALRESLAPSAGGPPRLSPLAYYRQLLRLVYRLLFLMTAEERGMLAPADNSEAGHRGYAIYQEYYSAANLRRRADRPLAGPADGGPSDASDLWPGLRQTFAIFRDDELAGKLGLNALNGELFRPNACADLESAACRNRELLAAVRDLSTFRDDGHVRRPVNYAAIDVEEFGSVYESLLDFHPRITPPPAPQFHLAAGAERKQTGSYYTPPELVRELIDSALTPVMDETTAAAQSDADKAAALLSLKVCDPAAGSGHFLLAAARRIAAQVARLQSGEAEPAPEAYRAALRQTIRSCIYAVDKNPFAVDLCKVVLWIEGHEPGLPLSFLDHRIKHGDSLLGAADLDALKAGIPNEAYKPIAGDDRAAAAQYRRSNAKELRGQLPLPSSEPAALDAITAQSQQLANMPDDSARQVDQKQAQYHANRGPETDWWAQKVACDLWAAAFFLPKQPPMDDKSVPTTGQLRRYTEPGAAIDGRLIGAAVDASDKNGFFHWPLEFPEVFASGGFDVVLGNPPWERLKLQSKEFFAHRDPAIANAPNKAARDRLIAALPQSNPQLAAEYHQALRRADAASNFVRSSGRFPLTGRGDVNTYSLFAELARRLLAPPGRAGVIIPTGIATDDTTKFFFADLAQSHSLASLYDFENRDGIFPGIHKSYKFCLLTVSGRGRIQESAQFAFYLRQTGQIKDESRRFELSFDDFKTFNPNTRTCPIFRERRDMEIARKMYQRAGVLWREARDGESESNPWGLEFFTIFHMSNDSGHFRTRAELESEGWQLQGNAFVRNNERYIPLYEAKLFHQYDHRFASFNGVSTVDTSRGNARNLTDDEKADPNTVVIPRYWVPEKEVAERLDNTESSGIIDEIGRNRTKSDEIGAYCVTFRLISRATDTRTVINTAAPAYGMGHSAAVITTGGGFWQPEKSPAQQTSER